MMPKKKLHKTTLTMNGSYLWLGNLYSKLICHVYGKRIPLFCPFYKEYEMFLKHKHFNMLLCTIYL